MQIDATLKSALEAVHHLTDPEPPWQAVLSAANRLVGSEAAVFLSFSTGPHAPQLMDTQNLGADPAAVRDYAGHFHREDPMTQPSVFRPAGSWLDTQVLLPPAQRQRSRYYADFMCRHRMGQLYSFIIENGMEHWSSLGFQRTHATDTLSAALGSERVRRFTDELQR